MKSELHIFNKLIFKCVTVETLEGKLTVFQQNYFFHLKYLIAFGNRFGRFTSFFSLFGVPMKFRRSACRFPPWS